MVSAVLDQDDVAGDDLRGGDAAPFAVANDRRVRGSEKALEFVKRFA
jgi:hypothetical protein